MLRALLSPGSGIIRGFPYVYTAQLDRKVIATILVQSGLEVKSLETNNNPSEECDGAFGENG